MKWLRRIRGAVGMGPTWAIAKGPDDIAEVEQAGSASLAEGK